ncbi:DNA cytosine methyltransferase [Novosphingobium sp. NBM11]|uniref:DNA cytosine methyltransferase n=1 Tax=Novosphingobium sp. NBM11 TaxID=2596914 RepID=UPI0018924CEF|nr:DNA cytosine methyltransferase [Novosphingobium sp. NBM11]MBF5091308.1 DNA cytosine methyltransferase [Novosphingobium sp. NBM11]
MFKILDLFCCAGGAAMGYHQAGFEVVGVDIKPQRRYPFEFVQADCLNLDPAFIASFDAIHASPPCQAHSRISRVSGRQEHHVDRIEETRDLLKSSGKPWIMENVVGAPLNNPIMLCGSMFALSTTCGAQLRRHRLFETNWNVGLLPQCNHGGSVVGVYGGHAHDHRRKVITVTGSTPQMNVVRNRSRLTFPVEEARKAMGIDWMTMAELSQAIPPAYTKWIGERLLQFLHVRSAA